MEFTLNRELLQSEVAWGFFPNQHQGKRYTEAFVKSFFVPFDQMQKNDFDLLNNRWLHNSVGKQLDGVGEIVGQGRAIKEGVVIPFFGFKSQPAGRGFGIARMRKNGEGYSLSYTLPDNEYRTLIYAKIILNNSHGTIPEIIESAKLLYNVPSVKVERTGVRELTLTVPRVVASDEPLFKLRPAMLPVQGGITLNIVSG
jgi:hypothetical protein